MKFSPDGRFALNSDGQVFSTAGWDWLALDIAAGYGNYDTPDVGLYQSHFPDKTMTRLGDYGVLSQAGFFANGAGLWLSQHQPGGAPTYTLDSNGVTFISTDASGRGAAGFVGDTQVFVRTPDFAALILRSTASGDEAVLDLPGYSGFVTILDGVVWYYTSGQLRAYAHPTPYLPTGGGRVSNAADGRVWYGGYISGWGQCACPLVYGPPCLGYVLSGDAHDFYPDIYASRPDGVILVGSSYGQDDSGLRVYELDVPNGRWRLNGGAWLGLVLVDLFNQPVEPPIVPPIEPPIVPPVQPPIVPPIIVPPHPPIVPPIKPPIIVPVDDLPVLASSRFLKGRV
jgi:hypothetical protein